MTSDSFKTRSTFRVGDSEYEIYRLDRLSLPGLNLQRLPYSVRILLENLLRNEDGLAVPAENVEALAKWSPAARSPSDIGFTPARVLMQDLTGVPAVVDLAAMRDAMSVMGGDPARINPLQPAELVIDHSVQVDAFGSREAFQINADLEFRRNRERYAFLRWGQKAFSNFRVVPPDTGIVHQVNLEYLARVVMSSAEMGKNGAAGHPVAYPDSLVGTDSHTTMVNGLGVLGWGVGGIEAEAALLGQPISMLVPQVVGFRMEGGLPEGATATDLVLTVTQMLRQKGVVGKFVEFYGPGLRSLTLADRATIANMAPEYGATCGIFPVDQETLSYLRLTGRTEDHIRLVEAYMKEQGLFYGPDSVESEYTDTLSLDLSTIEPSVAGPRNPQERVLLSHARDEFLNALRTLQAPSSGGGSSLLQLGGNGGPSTALAPPETVEVASERAEATGDRLQTGSVVIAAITSCTNTSNPSVLIAAGLLAKKASEKGLKSKPWVKTSLAPGSRVVSDYLDAAGLTSSLEQVGFYTVGYGCTTCIGNSGPLPEFVSEAIASENLVVCSVLSGNRNFEARINPEVRANYLMSPPLVVAYALAGRMDIDLYHDPIGVGSDGQPVYLHDIWPSQDEINETMAKSIHSEMFRKAYGDVFQGDERWNSLEVLGGERYNWPPSTYVKQPPYFEEMPREAPATVEDIHGARVLAMLGHRITTDHISPAGSIKVNSPAGKYLQDHGVEAREFGGETYGARRGNHEVMVRGTFANVRLRNQLAPGTEGGFTTDFLNDAVTTIFDASMHYQKEGVPLMVLAGQEYGTGSSRDWAAKGPKLLGVKVVLAESFERIHRTNLVGMGILPLQYLPDESAASLGLTGKETFDVLGISEGVATGFANGRQVTVRATRPDGTAQDFKAQVRIDTRQELLYYRHGGILPYVLRQLLGRSA